MGSVSVNYAGFLCDVRTKGHKFKLAVQDVVQVCSVRISSSHSGCTCSHILTSHASGKHWGSNSVSDRPRWEWRAAVSAEAQSSSLLPLLCADRWPTVGDWAPSPPGLHLACSCLPPMEQSPHEDQVWCVQEETFNGDLGGHFVQGEGILGCKLLSNGTGTIEEIRTIGHWLLSRFLKRKRCKGEKKRKRNLSNIIHESPLKWYTVDTRIHY